jgi:hypothetical protein
MYFLTYQIQTKEVILFISTTKKQLKRYINMKVNITIPTSLNEITLEQYQRFVSISEKNEEGNFLQLKMLEIFCGVPLNLAANMSLKDVNEITASITNMFTQEYKLKPIFKLGNTNFGFIPNLDNISLGEFSDLDNYFGKMDKMHNAMAVLYRPITDKSKDKYLIEQYNGSITYCDVMKKMPLDVVLGAMVFFYNLSNELLISSLNYLEENPQVKALIDKHNLETNGDGIHLSMLSLKLMLEDLMKFPGYNLQVLLPS